MQDAEEPLPGGNFLLLFFSTHGDGFFPANSRLLAESSIGKHTKRYYRQSKKYIYVCIYIYIIYREVLKRVAVTSLSHPRQVRLHKNKKGGKIEVIASFACDEKNNRKKTQRADAAALTRPVRPKLTPPPRV